MDDKKLYVIDASGYLYRAYFAIPSMTNEKGESTNALFGFIRSFLKLIKDFDPKYITAVFDGPNNAAARKALYPEYKAHRSVMPADLRPQIEWAKRFCELWGVSHLDMPDVEADDTMGALAIWGQEHYERVYLCTSDKDMCQMVNEKVSILNTHKNNLILTPVEVKEQFGVMPQQIIDLLAIVGDSSDNVPGMAGFGQKTAAALLEQYQTLDNILANADSIGGKKREIILRETELAKISRKLVTVDCDVPIPREKEFYCRRSAQLHDLKEFYLYMNFRSLVKELDEALGSKDITPQEIQAEHLEYITVDEEDGLVALTARIRSEGRVCFHTETTLSAPLRADLVGLGFAFEEKKAYYVPVNGKLGLKHVLAAFKPLFESDRIDFYGHNVKFDLQVLGNYGITISHITFDTNLASYILHAHMRQHSLDALATEYFHFTKIAAHELIGKGKQAISMRDVPIEKVATYCCEDADYILRIKNLLEKKMDDRGLGSLMLNVELPVMRVLADMERKGIYLDVAFLKKMSEEINAEIHTLEEEIYTLAGERFNLNSPKQLSEVLFQKLGIKAPKKTATGLSTNAEVLESLKDTYPIASKLLEYRLLEKLRSTYIDALPEEVDPRTSRIHCNFNQTVAATGRLASQDPNLQNIPIRTEAGRKIRAAFKPQKTDWSFLAADYSQIELRLLAHLSQDDLLIEAFTSNADIHRSTAASVFDIPLEQVTREQRDKAKAVNFGVIYGQQAFGLAQQLGIDVKEAAHIIELYFQKYSGIKRYIDESKQKTRTTGKAVTLIGRERLIPEIHSKNAMLRAAAERLAVNTPLQGSQADLIKLAMIEIQRLLKQENMEAYMVLQIHDELLFEAPDSELEKLKKLVKSTMEGIWSLRVPLVVDIAIGKNWEEC